MNQKTRDILNILSVIVLLIFSIILVFFVIAIYSKGARCMANPLVYGSKILSEQNNAEFTCECKFSNQPEHTIFVNKEEWTIERTGERFSYVPDYTNLTALKEYNEMPR